jgi:hypothetical protein
MVVRDISICADAASLCSRRSSEHVLAYRRLIKIIIIIIVIIIIIIIIIINISNIKK